MLDEDKSSHLRCLWGSGTHTLLKARELVRVGREIGVVQLRASKLLVGVSPCRIPPKIKSGSVEESCFVYHNDATNIIINNVDERCDTSTEIIESKSVTRTKKPSLRTERRAEILGKNIDESIHHLVLELKY